MPKNNANDLVKLSFSAFLARVNEVRGRRPWRPDVILDSARHAQATHAVLCENVTPGRSIGKRTIVLVGGKCSAKTVADVAPIPDEHGPMVPRYMAELPEWD